MFPLGSMIKSQVKQIAQQIDLESIAQKRESTGICFIGKRKFSDFMSEYVSPMPGDLIDIDTGEIVKQHQGIHNYTIGQGILASGRREKLFAVRKMMDQKTILVGAGTNHPSMLFDVFYTKKPHWINKSPFNGKVVAETEFRFQHGHKLQKCAMIETKHGLLVKLENKIRAICAGQFAVFYRDDECLGSAQISATGPFVRGAEEITDALKLR